MASLWIRQYSRVGSAGSANSGVGNIPIPEEPGVDLAVVTISGTSAQSAVVAQESAYVSIIGDVDFHYVVALNPTATANNLRMTAGVEKSFKIPSGFKIAVIAAA
jgi:hypothetical protein